MVSGPKIFFRFSNLNNPESRLIANNNQPFWILSYKPSLETISACLTIQILLFIKYLKYLFKIKTAKIQAKLL